MAKKRKVLKLKRKNNSLQSLPQSHSNNIITINSFSERKKHERLETLAQTFLTYYNTTNGQSSLYYEPFKNKEGIKIKSGWKFLATHHLSIDINLNIIYQHSSLKKLYPDFKDKLMEYLKENL